VFEQELKKYVMYIYGTYSFGAFIKLSISSRCIALKLFFHILCLFLNIFEYIHTDLSWEHVHTSKHEQLEVVTEGNRDHSSNAQDGGKKI
jgi:hypothetical protein